MFENQSFKDTGKSISTSEHLIDFKPDSYPAPKTSAIMEAAENSGSAVGLSSDKPIK